MATIRYDAYKTDMESKLSEWQVKYGLMGGDAGSSRTMYFYSKDADETDDSIVVGLSETSDATVDDVPHPHKIFEWTGTGNIIEALNAWRTANPDATSGGMYSYWNQDKKSESEIAAEKIVAYNAVQSITANISFATEMIAADTDASFET